MVAFEIFNATLWSLLTAINKMEGESCSVQLLRAYENSTGIYGQKSQFLDVSVEMTVCDGRVVFEALTTN